METATLAKKGWGMSDHIPADGVPEDQLGHFFQSLMKSILPDRSKAKHIKDILPKTWVGPDTVYDIMGFFACGSSSIRAVLLKWIILTLPSFRAESITALKSLFGLLYCHLGSTELRMYICQILCQICEERHVMGYRSKKIHQLINLHGASEPWLVELGHLFHLANPVIAEEPDMLFESLPLAQGIDPSWIQQFKRIREGNQFFPDSLCDPMNYIPSMNQTTPKKRKRRITQTKMKYSGESNRIPVTKIKTMDDLVENLDRLEYPKQFKSLLQKPFFLQSLVVSKEKSNTTRLFSIMTSELEEILSDRTERYEHDFEEICDHFNQIIYCCNYFEILPTELVHFLIDFLPTWSGFTFQRHILQLLSLLDPMPFVDLYNLVLRTLDRVYLQSSANTKIYVMEFHVSLLTRWSSMYWKNNPGKKFPLKMTPESFMLTIYQYTKHVDRLFYVGCRLCAFPPKMVLQCLRLLRQLSRLHSFYNYPFALVPGKGHMYNCLLSNISGFVDEIAFVCASYRSELILVKGNATSEEFDMEHIPTGVEKISEFNRVVMDFYYSLFKDESFELGPKQSSGNQFYLTEQDAQSFSENKSLRLTIKYHPAFGGVLLYYIQHLTANTNGTLERMTQIISEINKDAFFAYLASQQYPGLFEFRKVYVQNAQANQEKQ